MSETLNSVSMGSPMPKAGGQVFSQLETMMDAVKKEAGALENMKTRIKELEDVKHGMPELKRQLQESVLNNDAVQRKLTESELQIDQLRNDMQRLNDIYNEERRKHWDTQQTTVQLEQEKATMERELAYTTMELTKIGELRSSVAGLTEELNAMSMLLETERESASVMIMNLEQQALRSEKAKSEVSSHFWKLSEEVKGYKQEIQLANDENINIQQVAKEAQAELLQRIDAFDMQREDDIGQLEVAHQKLQLVSEGQEQKDCDIKSLNDELHIVSSKLTAVETSMASEASIRQQEKDKFESKIVEQSQTLSQLHAKNGDLDIELSDTMHKLDLMQGDLDSYLIQSDELRNTVNVLNEEKTKLAYETAKDYNMLTAERDEHVKRFVELEGQFEESQIEMKVLQSRHWVEMQCLKEIQVQLTDENDQLKRESADHASKLKLSETERSKLNEYVKGELANASNMVDALKIELDNRLEELSTTRKEKECIALERAASEIKLQELNKQIASSEESLQKSLEQHRAQIKHEVHLKKNCEILEEEKRELLQENADLMGRISEGFEEQAQLKAAASEAVQDMNVQNRKLATMKLQFSEQSDELDSAEAEVASLTDQLSGAEHQFRMEVGRLEEVVKNTKKAAAQQVADVNELAKNYMGEIETLRKHNVELQRMEQTALSDYQMIDIERSMANKSHQEIQQQMAAELASSRKEGHDTKVKLKVALEAKAKIERKVLELKVQQTTSDSEIVKLREYSKDVEHTANNASELLQLAIKSHKEETVQSGKLRVQLSTMETKTNELQSKVSALQKELGDVQSEYQKLQAATSAAATAMLQQLRDAEDAVTSERKRNSTDLATYNSTVAKLQFELDKVRDDAEKVTSKCNADVCEKDHQLQLLDQELDHMRFACSSKDGRVLELEKLRRCDGESMQQLRESLAMSERLVMSSTTKLELEQAQRKRVESQLIRLSQQPLSVPSLSLVDRVSAHVLHGSSSTVGSSADNQITPSRIDPHTVDANIERTQEYLNAKLSGKENETSAFDNERPQTSSGAVYMYASNGLDSRSPGRVASMSQLQRPERSVSAGSNTPGTAESPNVSTKSKPRKSKGQAKVSYADRLFHIG